MAAKPPGQATPFAEWRTRRQAESIYDPYTGTWSASVREGEVGEDYETIVAPEYERALRQEAAGYGRERRLGAQQMKARGWRGGGPWAHYMSELSERHEAREADIERERRAEIARMRMAERMGRLGRGGGVSGDLFEKRGRYGPNQFDLSGIIAQMQQIIAGVQPGAPAEEDWRRDIQYGWGEEQPEAEPAVRVGARRPGERRAEWGARRWRATAAGRRARPATETPGLEGIQYGW